MTKEKMEKMGRKIGVLGIKLYRNKDMVPGEESQTRGRIGWVI